MQLHHRPSSLSLRVKLILSYLAVALGAIFILAAVVLFAIQSYFANVQFDDLYKQAENETTVVAQTCNSQGSCNDLVSAGGRYSFNFLFIMGPNGQLSVSPNENANSANDDSITLITQALQQSLKGQQVKGHVPFSVRGNPPASFVYVGVPVYSNGPSGGSIIGALLVAQPELYPGGAPPPFLTNVNTAVIVSSAGIALLVVLFSLFMARQLTRPVEALTVAAEQMKRGKYTERVKVPKTQDEMGQLALTFNEMADTIESDVNELRQQDQMRRELIANIAHDLATPLTAVQGFSEALADDLISKPEERHETAQLIGREVQRLRRLVADMQQMSSLELGQIKLDLAPLDLSSLVDETLAVLTQESEEAGITITNEIAPSTLLVLADSDRITQILFNLLDNARRHTPRGGSITVSAQQEGQMLRVSVNDTGVGIDAKDLPHIFERFYRADRSRTGTTGGSGLGLSIVKAIITAHRGDTYYVHVAYCRNVGV